MTETEKLNSIRRYWLGLLAEEDRAALEAVWFDTDEDSELLAAVREDLIQDYAAAELTEVELTAFRTHLLSDPSLVEDIALAKIIHQSSDDQTTAHAKSTADQTKAIGWMEALLAALRNFSSGAIPASAFAAILIAVTIGGSIVWRSLSFEIDTAAVQPPKIDQETPLINTDPDGDPPKIVTDKSPIVGTPAPGAPPPMVPKVPEPPNKQSYVTLVLGAAVRSNSTLPEISVPQNVPSLRFEFPMPGLLKTYTKYRVNVTTADQSRPIWQSNLPGLSNKKTGQDLVVTMPTQNLVPGEYRFRLVGELTGANPETLWERGFRILRP